LFLNFETLKLALQREWTRVRVTHTLGIGWAGGGRVERGDGVRVTHVFGIGWGEGWGEVGGWG
jgi:hypothetical protein